MISLLNLPFYHIFPPVGGFNHQPGNFHTDPRSFAPIYYPEPNRESDHPDYSPFDHRYPVYPGPAPRYDYVSRSHFSDDYPYYSSSYYQTGSLQIMSTPSGATVYLNNKYRGKTPSSGYLDISSVTPGTYDLLVQYSNYLPYTQTLFIGRNQVTTINALLTTSEPVSPVTGMIQVQSEPAGAQVLLDNEYRGITPVNLQTPVSGEHTLTIQKDGYATYISKVQVLQGQTLPITAVLAGIPSTPVSTPQVTPVQTPMPAATRSGFPGVLVVFSMVIGWSGYCLMSKKN